MARKKTDARSASPTARHRRLAVFVGRWRTQGRTADGAPIHSADAYEWLPGEFFVVHRRTGRVGRQRVTGLEVIGVDPTDSRAYRTHFFDGAGNQGSERLTARGRTWTWLGRQVMGTPWHRCVSRASADGRRMSALHERSKDRRSWEPWMEVTLTRHARAARRR